MKKHKRRSAVLLSLLTLVMFLPMHAFAMGSIDLSHGVSLAVSCQDGDTPLAGAQFDLYQVAAADESGELTVTGDFTQISADIHGGNGEAQKTLASTLAGYILRDGISPADSGKTDSNGIVSFPSPGKALTPGLYLVLGHRHTQNGYRYDPAPFMVMLPYSDSENNTWVYDAAANAKYDSSEIPDTPQEDAIDREALKIWKDDGHEDVRPKEIIVQLLRDGKVCDTVTLNAANNWRYTWTGLDGKYSWTVVEQVPENYTVEVAREGNAFVVTNTYNRNTPDEPAPVNPSEPDESRSSLPQTGQLWWPVVLLICAGLLLVMIGLVCGRKNNDEKN